MKNDTPQTILLIHGTFASLDDDVGKAWWQRNSDFWNWLNSRLGDKGACGPSEERLFRWSGKNSERERMQAGHDLLRNWLSAFERQQKPYHLIAHSHGGSVVWHALQEAAASREVADGTDPLPNLKSWSTVGTPFLKFQPRFAYAWYTLAVVASALAFLAVVGTLQREIVGSPWQLPMAGRLGFAVFFLGLLMLLTLGAGWYSALRVWQLAMAWLQISRSDRIGKRAFEIFGGRWHGLWGEDDEAINMITVSAKAGPSLSSRFIAIPILGRITDEISWNLLQNLAQGNDRPGTIVTSVGPSPFPGLEPLPLPSQPEDIGREEVREHAPETVWTLRELLMRIARDEGEWSKRKLLLREQGVPWDTLLRHTSYFRVAADRSAIVPTSLASHIESSCNRGTAGHDGGVEPVRRKEPLSSVNRSRRDPMKASIIATVLNMTLFAVMSWYFSGLPIGVLREGTPRFQIRQLRNAAPVVDVAALPGIVQKPSASEDIFLAAMGGMKGPDKTAENESIRRWCLALTRLGVAGLQDNTVWWESPSVDNQSPVVALPFEQSMQAAAQIGNESDRFHVIASIVKVLIDNGMIDEGMQIVDAQIGALDPKDQMTPCSIFADSLAKADRPNEAYRIATGISYAPSRADALVLIAEAWLKSNQESDAIRVLNEAIDLVKSDNASRAKSSPGGKSHTEPSGEDEWAAILSVFEESQKETEAAFLTSVLEVAARLTDQEAGTQISNRVLELAEGLPSSLRVMVRSGETAFFRARHDDSQADTATNDVRSACAASIDEIKNQWNASADSVRARAAVALARVGLPRDALEATREIQDRETMERTLDKVIDSWITAESGVDLRFASLFEQEHEEVGKEFMEGKIPGHVSGEKPTWRMGSECLESLVRLLLVREPDAAAEKAARQTLSALEALSLGGIIGASNKASSLVSLVAPFERLSLRTEADHAILSAIQAFEGLDEPTASWKVSCWRDIAQGYAKLGQFEKTRAALESAERCDKQFPRAEHVRTLLLLSQSLRLSRDVDKARNSVLEAFDLAARIDDADIRFSIQAETVAEMASQEMLANVLSAANDPLRYKPSRTTPGWSKSRITIARALAQVGHYAKAREFCEGCLLNDKLRAYADIMEAYVENLKKQLPSP